MTMLEKVADAVGRVPLLGHENERAYNVSCARAALMAMRDADLDIFQTGFNAMFDQTFKDEYPMMSSGWEAMIEAILNEGVES